MKKCLWLILATFTFLVFFYSGTLVMSIIYPLDEAHAYVLNPQRLGLWLLIG